MSVLVRVKRDEFRVVASPREQPPVLEGEVVERLDYRLLIIGVTSVKWSKFMLESSRVVIDEFKMAKVVVIHL